jgi:hypothetical protein
MSSVSSGTNQQAYKWENLKLKICYNEFKKTNLNVSMDAFTKMISGTLIISYYVALIIDLIIIFF